MTTKPTRIDELTPAQRDRMATFAQEWIQRGWRTHPLTEEEWKVWEDGARKCYEYAGIPWPALWRLVDQWCSGHPRSRP